VSGKLHILGHFTPGKEPLYPLAGMVPRARLTILENVNSFASAGI